MIIRKNTRERMIKQRIHAFSCVHQQSKLTSSRTIRLQWLSTTTIRSDHSAMMFTDPGNLDRISGYIFVVSPTAVLMSPYLTSARGAAFKTNRNSGANFTLNPTIKRHKLSHWLRFGKCCRKKLGFHEQCVAQHLSFVMCMCDVRV
jgi:hypothetical protein